MSVEPSRVEPKVERRREISYGTPGTILYKDDRPILWIPDNFGLLTKNLPSRELEALLKELKKYLVSSSPNGGVT
jgi:hypothetical protein